MTLSLHRTVDLDPLNNFDAPERLSVFLASRRMHEEAYHVFYGGHTFRIFPTHWRFFGDKVQSVLSRLPPRYRKALVSLELRLVPGRIVWSNPPKSWRVTNRLALEDMVGVRKLRVFMECDPSQDIFKDFRVERDFFTNFAGEILEEILRRIPSLGEVQFDKYPSDGLLVTRLMDEVKHGKKRIVWGPESQLEELSANL